ncbi:hypothetical protein SAMN06296952_2735 [Oscillospiraceae bacterium]|nr:hypothetical protein SAMN06296952_2735 [Oscillospiraceae bacterium]
MKKFYRVMLILFAIHFAVALTVGIVFLIKYRAIPEAGGYVLTDEFIRSDCTRSVYLLHYWLSYLSAFIGSIGILTEVLSIRFAGIPRRNRPRTSLQIRREHRARFRSVITPIAMLILSVFVFIIPWADTLALLTQEPNIIRCEVESKYEEESRDGKARYYIVYVSGRRTKVSRTAYDAADPGNQYYLVYYGNKHIKTYDASVYALP